MKVEGGFTYGKFEIPFKKYGKVINLVPFGDVHRSAPLCHVEKWHEWLDWAKNLDNAWFIGMGDYDDLASESERAILNNAYLHDSTVETLDSLYRGYVSRFAKEIGFMKGRLIGMIEGNHYSKISSGITTTHLLCEKMDCKYLGVSAFIRVILRRDIHHTHRIDIWAHHGLGGGRTVGSSLNKVENMVDAADADIYLMGHDHKKGVVPKSRLKLSESRNVLTMENRKILLIRTGGFLRGYVDQKQSYIADRAYSPADIGTVLINITPQRKHRRDEKTKTRLDRRWVDLNASL